MQTRAAPKTLSLTERGTGLAAAVGVVPTRGTRALKATVLHGFESGSCFRPIPYRFQSFNPHPHLRLTPPAPTADNPHGGPFHSGPAEGIPTMGQISTGVGLVSGINIAGIVDQLIAVETRPKTLIQQRNTVLQSQQAAFGGINAKLLSLKLRAQELANPTTFRATSATSSNEDALTVTSSAGATRGSFDFRVKQLVSAQHTVSRGFHDASAPLAPGGTTLTLEPASARLDRATRLDELNGGKGVTTGQIRISDRSGASALIDLSDAITADDVVQRINNATDISVTAALDGDRFTLTDATGSNGGKLTVSNVGTTSTATSLGLAGTSNNKNLNGSVVHRLGRDSQLTSLNDGNGVSTRGGVADLQITTAAGGSFNLNLDDARTLGDVIDAVDAATGGDVTAAISANGRGLTLTDHTGGLGLPGSPKLTVTFLNGSSAAADLGILATDADDDGQIVGSARIAALGSKLLSNLNGGQGLDFTGGATLRIRNAAGSQKNINLAGSTSVSDLIDRINDADAGVTASLNDAGNGLRLVDNTGGGGDLTITDQAGTIADQLGLAGTYSNGIAQGQNLQSRYVTASTSLDSLGVARGKFTLTDSAGDSATVDLTQGNENSFGDVIQEINSRGLAITARLNDNGDGILLEDTGPGTLALRVEEAGSTTAADLRILGEAANPGDSINGSFETTIDVTATDTLEDVATKIGEAGVGVTATVINDGSDGTPFRLSLSSREGGRGGAFSLDDGGLDLGLRNLAEAQDAVVFFGGANGGEAITITGGSNTLQDVLPGVTIDLKAPSNGPVSVTVGEDDGSVVEAVQGFVEGFNSLIESIDEHDSYNAETEERGLLLGDPALSRVKSALFNTVIGANSELTGQYKALSQVGITVGRGAKLQVDEAKLRSALADNPDAVRDLFTFKQTGTVGEGDDAEEVVVARGVGVELSELLDRLTGGNGPIDRQVEGIDGQLELNRRRIEGIDQTLARRRARLESQFAAMEQALSQLQGQSQALGQLQSLAATAQGRGGTLVG